MRTSLYLNRKGFSTIFVDFIMYFCFLLILVLFYLLSSIEFGNQSQEMGLLAASDQIQVRLETLLRTPVRVQDTSIPLLDLLLLVEHEPEKYLSFLQNTFASSSWFSQETDGVSIYFYTLMIVKGDDPTKKETLLYETKLPKKNLALFFPDIQKAKEQQGALKFFGRAVFQVPTLTGETLTLFYDGFCDTCLENTVFQDTLLSTTYRDEKIIK